MKTLIETVLWSIIVEAFVFTHFSLIKAGKRIYHSISFGICVLIAGVFSYYIYPFDFYYFGFNLKDIFVITSSGSICCI